MLKKRTGELTDLKHLFPDCEKRVEVYCPVSFHILCQIIPSLVSNMNTDELIVTQTTTPSYLSTLLNKSEDIVLIYKVNFDIYRKYSNYSQNMFVEE